MVRSVVFGLVSIVISSGMFFGCGSSSPSAPSPGSTGATGATVSIPVGAQSLGAAGYTPDPITVSAGTTVTWTNGDAIAHTATSNTGGLFDSGSIAPGGMFRATLQSKGTITYHCTFHQGMVGTIIVQ